MLITILKYIGIAYLTLSVIGLILFLIEVKKAPKIEEIDENGKKIG